MAQKTPVHVRRLSGLAYACLDTSNENDISSALRGIARWLDEHPFATLLSININYAANDDENYLTVIIDSVEDDELN